jgi:hypothetical protein
VIAGAVVVTLVRPVSWALGLASFLAGGGLAIVAWPILALPTPTGLQNALGGPVSTMVFGAPSAELFALIVGGGAAAVAVLVGAIIAGAWAERQGIAVALDAAVDEGIEPGRPSIADLAGAPGTGRVAVLRLLSLAPVALAATIAWQGIYDATYRELVLPQDLATPLPLRVLRDVPWQVVALLAVWLLADAAAAVGVRRLVLERRPVFAAWLLGWVDLVRRPLRVIPTELFGVGVLMIPIIPAVAAAAIGWDRVRELLVAGTDPWVALAAVFISVAVWLGGLVLTGVAAAVRAAAWTLELPRRSVAGAGGPSPG